MGLKTFIRNLNKVKMPYYLSNKKLDALHKKQKSNSGIIDINGIAFNYHHAEAFVVTYKELFLKELYAFKPKNERPYIIDCGANMGLSVLYFAAKYPDATIDAFEPDDTVFEYLQKNITNFKLANVTAYKKAVWINEDKLKFYTDSGMGGSIAHVFGSQSTTLIDTIILANYLQKKVDFLKLDIEGAEVEVLKHCKPYLKNVDHIFVEYHSFINQEQYLELILSILKESGFRYHLTQSFSRKRPFIDGDLSCENMDMAINIFGYRL